MTRKIILAAALSFGIANPAFAQAPVLRAVPAVAMDGNVIAAGALWACGADGCTAREINSRPAVACARVVREIGRVDSFTADGTPIDADALAKCNARARSVEATVANR